MEVKETLSSVEGFRKMLPDSLAPELRGFTIRLDSIDKRLEKMDGGLSGFRDELRSEIHAAETRMREAVENAKREILLTVQLADAEQRNAMLAQKLTELEQKSPH